MAHEPQVGEIYQWFATEPATSLFVVLAVHYRIGHAACDWLKLRGSHKHPGNIGSVFDGEPMGDATLFTGTLTDSEHRLAMTALLDAETYIWEHTA